MLDLGMPELDGIEVIEGLRGWSTVPILVVSGRTDAADKVEALDAGADDYVTKPFAIDELLARIRALTRRVPSRRRRRGAVVAFGDVHGRPRGQAGHRSIHAGGRERRAADADRVEILELLRAEPRQAGHPRDLLTEVWGPTTRTTPATCACTSRSCARSSSPSRPRPRHLVTEAGMGYRFVPDADAQSRPGARDRGRRRDPHGFLTPIDTTGRRARPSVAGRVPASRSARPARPRGTRDRATRVTRQGRTIDPARDQATDAQLAAGRPHRDRGHAPGPARRDRSRRRTRGGG